MLLCCCSTILEIIIMLSTAQLTLLRNGVSSSVSLDEPGTFILEHGWAAATTRQYAAAVNKFLVFLATTRHIDSCLPYRSELVYRFILWCSASSSKRVTTSTIKRYLSGLRMWHSLHNKSFPQVDVHRVRLLLKSCTRTQEATSGKIRVGLTLRDVTALSDELTTTSRMDLVTKTIILVGFWGLARLGELTANRDHPNVFIRRRDVTFHQDGTRARIALRLAKTARPGEIQHLHLASQPNRLDPVNALHAVLQRIPGEADDPLFPGTTAGKPMHRSLITAFLKANGPTDGHQWSGHSLRIGGASFQRHAGRSVKSLKRLGRWQSDASKLYVNKYSIGLQRSTRALTRELHF